MRNIKKTLTVLLFGTGTYLLTGREGPWPSSSSTVVVVVAVVVAAAVHYCLYFCLYSVECLQFPCSHQVCV